MSECHPVEKLKSLRPELQVVPAERRLKRDLQMPAKQLSCEFDTVLPCRGKR